MKEKAYHEKVNNRNEVHLRELCAKLPVFCKQFFIEKIFYGFLFDPPWMDGSAADAPDGQKLLKFFFQQSCLCRRIFVTGGRGGS